MDSRTNSDPCLGMLALGLIIVMAFIPSCAAGFGVPEGAQDPNSLFLSFRTFLDDLCQGAHRCFVSLVGRRAIETAAENVKLFLDSVFGQEHVRTVLEFVQVAVGFLSEGLASGLNVIAVYVTEILKATGITVTLPFPQFTAEGVASVLQWSLLALLGYWVVSLALRLFVSLLWRVMYLLKLCVALWLFAVIVSDTSASTNTTAWRLAALVCCCALLSVGRSGADRHQSGRLESHMRGLERRLEKVERRQEK